jgi:hypothetical protein
VVLEIRDEEYEEVTDHQDPPDREDSVDLV